MENRRELKQVLTRGNRESYMSALKEFTQMSIVDPTFFRKSPEEQKEMAMQMIQKHKEGSTQEADHTK